MASNNRAYVSDDDVFAHKKPKPFTEVVSKHKDKLPIAVEVTGGGRYSGTRDAENKNVQLHKGDILWVTRANVESATVAVDGAKKKEQAVMLPQGWPGKFKLPSTEEYPSGHVYTSVADLANDFPIFVTVKEEFDVDRVKVTEGSRLRLHRQTTTATGGKFLMCDIVDTNDSVSLPDDLNGKFEKTDDDIRFELNDVQERLPVHVVAVSDGDGSDGIPNSIPGIPVNYEGSLLLSSVSYSEAVFWETSNQEDVGILKVPSGTKMEVIVLQNWEEDKGQAMEVMELAKSATKDKSVYATPVADNEEALEDLGIPNDATLIIPPTDNVERILVQGNNAPLLLNKNYRGYFKPQTEYGTGQDLVNYGIHREVRVTKPYQPKEGENGLSALYPNDMVKLHLSSAKMFSEDEDTEVLVVELERTSSKVGAKLGVIYVPASEVIGFQEKFQYSIDQKIAQLAHTSQVPLNATFTNGPVNKSSPDSPANSSGTDEEILREESPLMILGSYKYPVVKATILNKESPQDSKVVEISEHWKLKLHRVRRPINIDTSVFQTKKNIEKSDPVVKKVSQIYFDRVNGQFQQILATKNVKRRGKKTAKKDAEGKRKTWVQRHLSFKSIQQRLSRAPTDHAGENGQTTEEWTI